MTTISEQKATLRDTLRSRRREFAAGLPREISALVFRQPPAPLLALVPEGATIGIYRSDPGEAPTSSYTRFFFEAGHTIALPRVTTLKQPMRFHAFTDPYGESDLEGGPLGLRQPSGDLPELVPEVLFMPLVGFTARGERLGQGGGFYDRTLARLRTRRTITAIGVGFDGQRVSDVPHGPDDQRLDWLLTDRRACAFV